MYTQTKDECVALLKRMLGDVGRHDVPLNPQAFAVFFEHLAGINPPLSRRLAHEMTSGSALDARTIEALHRAHVEPTDAQASEAVRGRLQTVVEQLQDSATQTAHTTRGYRDQLSALNATLNSDVRPPQAAVATASLIAMTTELQATVAALQQVVQDSGQEIARLRSELERARTEAVTDALTGLMNRKGFAQTLRDVLAEPPPGGRMHCLLMLDIDHFKQVNDTFGHPVGDAVISGIGQILLGAATEPTRRAARMGGEEFAVVLESTTPTDAMQFAEETRRQIKHMQVRRRGAQDALVRVTASAGIARWKAGDDAQALVSAADAALYRAKQAGRDRVALG